MLRFVIRRRELERRRRRLDTLQSMLELLDTCAPPAAKPRPQQVWRLRLGRER
jgi:hypothetical protein